MSLGGCYYALCRTRLGHRAARISVAAARHIGWLRRFHLPYDALSLDHDAVAALMRLWPRIHWSCGDGMMPPAQMLAMYRLAVDWPLCGDIVELGSWTGLTTCYLAAACCARGSGTVHAVDTFEGTKEGGGRYASVARFDGNTLPAFQKQTQRAGVADRIETHVGYTTAVAGRYQGGPIRMLLIDADHSYKGVADDFRAWYPHIASGGVVVFHDYGMDGVARFVDGEMRADARFVPTPGVIEENIIAFTKRPNIDRHAHLVKHRRAAGAEHGTQEADVAEQEVVSA